MDYIKLAQRTIAMLSSMIESGECHTTRSKEMKDNALNGLEQLCIGAVSCRLSSPALIEPLDFDGEPLYYKMNGMYGYLMPSGRKVLWFYSDADGGLFYDELEGWSVLNDI